jgi:aralkylamine N-acetyltransferase
MNIRLIKKVHEDEFIQLYKDAGWWSVEYDQNTSFIETIVTDSFLFAGAFDVQGKMIGMGRVLSDGCSDAYIQDVVVLKSFRKQGIGGKIINFLIQELKKHNIDWVGLIGEPGTKLFYESLGFNELKEHIPMKLEM